MSPLQCTSESSSATCVTISPTKPVINYNVKLVNPVRKSEYVIRKVRGIPKCTTIDELKTKLCEEHKIDSGDGLHFTWTWAEGQTEPTNW